MNINSMNTTTTTTTTTTINDSMNSTAKANGYVDDDENV